MSIKYLTNKEYTPTKDDNLLSGYILITTDNSEILLTEEEYKQQYLED